MESCIDKFLNQTYDKLDKILTGTSDEQASYIEHALSNNYSIHTSQPQIPVHGRVLQCYLRHCRIMLQSPDDISKEMLHDLAFPEDAQQLCKQLCTFLTSLSNPECRLKTRKTLSTIGESMLYWVIKVYQEKDDSKINLSELWRGIVLLMDRIVERNSDSNESLTPRPTPSTPASASHTLLRVTQIRRMSTGRISLNSEGSARPSYSSFETILDAEAERVRKSSRCSSDEVVHLTKAATVARYDPKRQYSN